MATLKIEHSDGEAGDEVRVELSRKESFSAFTGSFSFPMQQIDRVEYVDDVQSHVKGLRVGTAWPGIIRLGRYFHHGHTDFVAAYHHEPGYVITLKNDPDGTHFGRVLMTSPKIDGLDEKAVRR